MADNLSADQRNKIKAYQDAYAVAKGKGDKQGMADAHAGAEAIRNQAGYSGGADGSEYTPLQDAPKGVNDIKIGGAGEPIVWPWQIKQQQEQAAAQQNMTGDKRVMTAQQQAQIQTFKDAYAQAQARGDKAGMEAAHQQAEALRKQVGNYSGGADGSGYSYGSNPMGGMTAEEMAQWVEAYDKANQNTRGPDGYAVYDNGYSIEMNNRSLANKIRQQMYANSQAYGSATPEQKQYLHQQNLELAKILKDASGGAESTFNPQTGRWETYNANLGYGINVGGGYEDRDFQKKAYGMTDEQIDHYIDDPSRYFNFVDQSVIRNWQNEDNGFTGRYAQFANGPYMALAGGNNQRVPRFEYVDVIGDGFNEGSGPRRDADGNILPPAMKNNQFMTDYTRDKLGYTYNGVIQPNFTNRGPGNNIYAQSQEGAPQYTEPAEHEVNPEWAAVSRHPTIVNGSGGTFGGLGNILASGGGPTGGTPGGGLPGGSGGGFGGSSSVQGGGGQFDGLINQMMDANIEAQKAALEQAYNASRGELDTALAGSNAAFEEQKRQTTGQSDRDAANWRELANAQGLNTGAVGQAALAQNNQLQSDLSTLGEAQASAQANIEQQRALLAQKYQYDIIRATADNDFKRAQMLYQEAVRADEALRQQQQFYAGLAADQMKAMMGLMAKGGSSSGGGRRGRGPGGGNNDNPILEEPNDLSSLAAGGPDRIDVEYPGMNFGNGPIYFTPNNDKENPLYGVSGSDIIDLGLGGKTSGEIIEMIRNGELKFE